jgi:quercetin dioxygenase-like cupin family protein
MASTFSTAVALRGEQTDGAISVIENTVPAQWDGPPLHHHDFDELFWVLEGELTFQLGDELLTRRAGELTFQLGDELLTRRAGELAFAPRGVHHTFAHRGDAAARTLIVCTPAGLERHFARIEADQARVDAPQWALAPIPRVTTVGPQIGREAPS